MNNSDTTFQTYFDTKLTKLMEAAYSVFEVDLTAEIGQQKAMFLDASFPIIRKQASTYQECEALMTAAGQRFESDFGGWANG